MSKQKPWPADRVERRSVKSLMAYPRNARVHSDEQVDQIAASMREFGWTIPVLVDEAGVLIAGHGRVMAANKLGIEDIPVMVATGWTEDQKRAYRIADNALPEKATWDAALLRLELTDLKLADYDLKLTGFDDLQLVQFMAGGPNGTDPEATPEPPVVPVSKRGDVWVLGNHRVMCGDATSAEDVERLLDGAKADLVFTDPPYNFDYSGRGQNNLGTIQNDNLSDEAFEQFLDASFALMQSSMKDLASIYVFHPDAASGPKLAFERYFAKFFQKDATLIWVKQAAGMGWQDYRSQHEPILYGWKSGKGSHVFMGDRTKTTVWEFNRDAQSGYEHPTQKPVSLAVEAIQNSSRPGDIIFDPFVGSGTSIVGSETTSRKCVAMDLEARYVDVSVLRWESLSGKQATLLDSSGRTFAEVSNERRRGRSGTRKGSGAPRRSRPNSAGAPSLSN